MSFRRSSSSYNIGDSLHGWKVVDRKRVPELNITAIRLDHQTRGAKYLHLSNNEDANNAFSVAFRTVPSDSSGIAHILEHSVLCGSESYPVRDPFMKMINRSLSTFMNAMTGPDYTLYPFSTQNKKDFYNLMSVYLDLTFKPLIKEQDFMQEGWRLEHTVTEDPNSPLMIKGVVFNEMKGVYADSNQIFMRYLLNSILPSHTYSNCSGGIPKEIPSLTWDNLKKFHKRHYSPGKSHVH